MPMKTFSRHRTSKEIRKACKLAGFTYSQAKFDQGSDYVTFTFVHGRVRCRACYSTVNGRCFGELEGVPGSDWFETDSTRHETRRWFKALLDFIYVQEPPKVAAH